MIKKILAFTISLNLLLAGVAAFAAPRAEYFFYNDETEELCVFGRFDKRDYDARDVGIYVDGRKFSYVKDGNTMPLDKQNKEESPKFGISLKAPENYFDKVNIYPYEEYTDDYYEIGETVTYNIEKEEVENNKSLLFEEFTGYEEGKTFESDERFFDNSNIIARVYSDTQNMSIINEDENKILKISDNSERYGSAIEISVPEYERILTFEIRFKFDKTITDGFAMGMNFFGDALRKQEVFSIVKSSGENDGLAFVNNGGNSPFTGGVNMDDKWFTMKVRMDTLLRQTSISIEGEDYSYDLSETIDTYNYVWQDTLNKRVIAYNQCWYNEYKGENIKKIYISTASGTCGDYYIDYIKLNEGGEEILPVRTRARSQAYNVIADPKPRY